MAGVFLNPLKKAVHHCFKWAGFELIKSKNLPYGLNSLRDIKKLCHRMGRNVNIFFDVGANIGQTCLGVKKEFPDAQIFAFEPTPAVFSQLKESIAGMPWIQAYQTAFGPKPCCANLFMYEYTQINGFVYDAPHKLRFGEAPINNIQCDMTTIDLFCAEKNIDHIDVLKIDTEGFELPILQGAKEMLGNGKIDFIYFEFNQILPSKYSTGGALAPVCEFLQPQGFHFISSYTDWITPDGDLFVVCNALLVHQ